MDRPLRRIVATTLQVALLVALAGCGPSASPVPSPSGGGSTTPPSPSPGGTAFQLTVVPTAFTGIIHAGSKVILLVSVDGTASDGSVTVTASAPGASASVEPAELVPGGVAEVSVTGLACPGQCDQVTRQVTVVATRGDVTRTETRELTLSPEVDQLEAEARAHLAPFVDWLAANEPELGITASTVWESVPAPWVLVVEHHLFFSEAWELDISWHVMIAPDDWSVIVLRHRGTELQPSFAFKIDSVSGTTAPHATEVPDAVWR